MFLHARTVLQSIVTLFTERVKPPVKTAQPHLRHASKKSKEHAPPKFGRLPPWVKIRLFVWFWGKEHTISRTCL